MESETTMPKERDHVMQIRIPESLYSSIDRIRSLTPEYLRPTIGGVIREALRRGLDSMLEELTPKTGERASSG